jgi:hypothetical protein
MNSHGLQSGVIFLQIELKRRSLSQAEVGAENKSSVEWWLSHASQDNISLSKVTVFHLVRISIM